MWGKQATMNDYFDVCEAIKSIEIDEDYLVDFIYKSMNYQFYNGLPADLNDEICEVIKEYCDCDGLTEEIEFVVERWLEDNDENRQYKNDTTQFDIGSWDFTSKILDNNVVNETIKNMFLSVYYYSLINGLLWEYLDLFKWNDTTKQILDSMKKEKKYSYKKVVEENKHIFAWVGLVPNDKKSEYDYDCEGFMSWFYDKSPYCNDDKIYNLNIREITNDYEYISNIAGYVSTGNGYYHRDCCDYLEGIMFSMNKGSFRYLSNCMSLDEDVCERYFEGKSLVDYENKANHLEDFVGDLYRFHRNRKERVEQVENFYLRARYNPNYALCKKVLSDQYDECS
jgi:hypothetical protein